MSGDVTVTGGSNHGESGAPPGYDLGFNTSDRAYIQAQALANALNSTYGASPTQVFPGPVTPGGLVISTDQFGTSIENLAGFSAIAIQDTGNPQSIIGGGAANQTVVAGLGDLTFFAQGTATEDYSNITLAAIGGNNLISFAGNNGNDVAWASTGDDTVIAGDGVNSILLGAGHNSVQGGSGLTSIEVNGNDTLSLGTGSAIVYVDPAAAGATELVHGSAHTTVPTGNGSYSLIFINGSGASTVQSGAGSYHILGGTGGGVFTGGSDGSNYLAGGTGNTTLNGAGNNDFLVGGSGTNLIRAGNGATVFIDAGTGASSIHSGTGNDFITASGNDTIQVGSGFSYVDASGAPATVSALVRGANSVTTGNNYSLDFVGGAGASTILGGAGRYLIDGGTGGGVFHGGSNGLNYIHGTGAMTIFGGGDGDVLQGGDSGNNVVTAGSGTEVLGAGMGNTTLIGNSDKADFSFQNIGTLAGAYTIDGFHTGDLMHFHDEATATYALNHYDVSVGSNGTITLADHTTIVLQGYQGSLGTQTGYGAGPKTDLVT